MAQRRSFNASLPVQMPLEPMQLDANEDNDSNDGDIGTTNDEAGGSFAVENASLDLESYASSYSGLSKIQRLLFIADHCPALRIEALKLALAYVKENTFNTNMYTQIHVKLSDAIRESNGNPDAVIGPLDMVWLEQRSKKAHLKLEKLDADLKNYKSNSIKESIRRGHDDLGDHYLDMGDLTNALKCYSRSRDYCTSGKHVLNMCLNVIRVSIQLQNWSHVFTYVAKAEGTPEYVSKSPVGTKLVCAAGLAELAAKRYKKAAKLFLEANFDHFNQDNCAASDLLSINNVAVYGGLTALATFDREELYKSVISSSSFKLFLELEPQLRDAISKFYNSAYAKCLSILRDIKDNLMLDIYLQPHVNQLYIQIRQKALVQYFSPYSSADMNRMADSFNTTVSLLEDEVMHLILDGQIQVKAGHLIFPCTN